MKATVWEGVYPDWARAPEAQDAFNEQRWINAQAEKALENLATLRREGAFSLSVKTRDYVLPVAAAMLARGNAVVRILDFGGGLASSYFTLRRCVRGPLDYHVVEMRSMVSEGRRLLSELDEVTFQDTIPQGHPVDWDIVHRGQFDTVRGGLARHAGPVRRAAALAGGAVGCAGGKGADFRHDAELLRGENQGADPEPR